MGTIIISENVTLDGVMQDPTGDSDFRHGGWFNQISDADRSAWAAFGLDEALTSQAMLLGRRTYEFLSSRWPARTGAWADRLNAMPKYVVSATLTDPGWNARVLKGDAVQEVRRLKDELDGAIVVAASGRLAHELLDNGLVDEVRLVVYPFVLGSGDRLFRETTSTTSLRLVENRTLGDSLVLLTYAPLPRAGRS